MKMHPHLLAAMLALVSSSLLAQENVVPNSSFERGRDGNPSAWQRNTWTGEGRFVHAETGRTGNRSVMLSSDAGGDLSWSANVPVEATARYRLSGWIKTENVQTQGDARGALLNLHNLQSVATRAVTGTTDWTRVETEFEAGDNEMVTVNCLLGGWGRATGRAWFDDIVVEQIRAAQPAAPSIAVDAGAVGQPMAPEIYSQFIEHLGRCIYGGIWAEMLEDRKFYHPVTAQYNPYRSLRDSAFPVVGASPWQIIGEAGSVTMSTDKPFVGRHTPVVKAGSGLRQLDLGVTAGKKYEGYLWMKSADRAPGEVEVALVAGESSAPQTVRLGRSRAAYRRFAFTFTAPQTTDKAALEIRVRGGDVCLGTVSLMPADNVEGMRADTLDLLRQLRAPIYRWPGGNFVSGYDWRDGIGDRDRRPPRTNPAWTGVEHNDFGMHEFIRFCELVESEPWITVNTGFGDAHSAAAQLEYCNGSAKTQWGSLRAKNGHPESFEVKYWGIGNEMWGNWQLGHMQLGHYVLKQNWVVDTMRQVDPEIITIASGDIGAWSTGLLKGCSDHMDYIAEHFYCQERPGLMAHIRQIPDNIRRKAEWHRKARADLPELKGKDIRISMTEWNYWYGPHKFGELGTRYFLKDGLGIAAGLHEYARQSDIIGSAFYAQTVNVIGCIKTSRRNAAFESTGLVLKLYRDQFGELPVQTRSTGALDAQAAWSRDKRRLTIGVVNGTQKAVEVPFTLTGARLKSGGTKWQIAGEDPMAYNDPDEAPRLRIEEASVGQVGDKLTLAPCSVTVFAFEVE